VGIFSPKTKPKVVLGVILLLCTGGFLLALLRTLAHSSLDGNERIGYFLFATIFSAFLWVPAVILGLLLIGGGRYPKATRKPKQIDCLACYQSMPSLALFCPHCGSEAHRAPNCQSCGAPRQAHHRFCRACGAKAA
jgi:hypothetical protein